jgi:hypothetical protein
MCDSLCEILGVAGTNDLGKYLGFPLKSNARNSGDFNFVVEKVQVKLSSWKSMLLSSAGRVVLIQSVTSSIPAYYMQNTPLPSRIYTELDRLNINFLGVQLWIERRCIWLAGIRFVDQKGMVV